MKTLMTYFYECAYIGNYETVGDDVNYKFVESTDSCLEIYFQCSNSVKDWVLNFMFPKVVYGEFRVHRGFLFAYNQIRELILNKIYNSTYKSIIIVGYSHGGGLAQICHEDLVYHFPNINIKTYAFESPRCLSVPKKYRERWKDMIIVRDGCDLVTHLPPRIFGFNDLGTMLKIKGDTKLVDNKLPKCIKYHYPQVVLDGLKKSLSLDKEKSIK